MNVTSFSSIVETVSIVLNLIRVKTLTLNNNMSMFDCRASNNLIYKLTLSSYLQVNSKLSFTSHDMYYGINLTLNCLQSLKCETTLVKNKNLSQCKVLNFIQSKTESRHRHAWVILISDLLHE